MSRRLWALATTAMSASGAPAARMASSTSRADTFSPPTLSASLSRSQYWMLPSASWRTMSPVRAQPSSVKNFSLASSLWKYSRHTVTPRMPRIHSSPISPTSARRAVLV